MTHCEHNKNVVILEYSDCFNRWKEFCLEKRCLYEKMQENCQLLNFTMSGNKMYCIVLYCIVLYCRLFNVSFYNSEYTLIKTNMKQFQGLHKTVHSLQNEHAHLFSRNKVLIKFLNCLVLSSMYDADGSFSPK